MGTRWTARLAPASSPGGPSSDEVVGIIEAALGEVDGLMSGWREDSEISAFNRHRGDGPFAVSDATAEVLRAALDVHRRSGGAFDVTVGPLHRLWGFGAGSGSEDGGPPAPSADALAAIRARTGSGLLEVIETSEGGFAASKSVPDLEVDLSGIAKGYAVDRVSDALSAAGWANHLFELGGEVRVRGVAPGGRSWRLGVSAPRPGAEAGAGRDASEVAATIPLLDGEALATSGGYRDFREIPDPDGGPPLTASHVLDPRAGVPVARRAASASVIAATCLEADAWATALFVLGPEEGLALADRLGLAALFLSAEDGRIVSLPSEGWSRPGRQP